MAEPLATRIIAGPALLYVAPLASTLPTVTGSPAVWPPTWPAAWIPVGYTDKGVDVVYTPTVKPYTPDEETFSVYDVLTAEKIEISAVLAEATLTNLKNAIAAATYTNDATSKVNKLAVGTGVLSYVMLGIQGPTPIDTGITPAQVGDGLIVVAQKTLAQSSFTWAATKKDIRKYSVKWDIRKISGVDALDIWEFYH
jgi:hypothetical protein